MFIKVSRFQPRSGLMMSGWAVSSFFIVSAMVMKLFGADFNAEPMMQFDSLYEFGPFFITWLASICCIVFRPMFDGLYPWERRFASSELVNACAKGDLETLNKHLFRYTRVDLSFEDRIFLRYITKMIISSGHVDIVERLLQFCNDNDVDIRRQWVHDARDHRTRRVIVLAIVNRALQLLEEEPLVAAGGFFHMISIAGTYGDRALSQELINDYAHRFDNFDFNHELSQAITEYNYSIVQALLYNDQLVDRVRFRTFVLANWNRHRQACLENQANSELMTDMYKTYTTPEVFSILPEDDQQRLVRAILSGGVAADDRLKFVYGVPAISRHLASNRDDQQRMQVMAHDLFASSMECIQGLRHAVRILTLTAHRLGVHLPVEILESIITRSVSGKGVAYPILVTRMAMRSVKPEELQVSHILPLFINSLERNKRKNRNLGRSLLNLWHNN